MGMMMQRTEEVETYMTRIVDAYKRHFDGQGYIYIAELRSYVGGDRILQDAALIFLARDPQVSIIPQSQQGDLEDWHRAGAVRIGNQDRHLIKIS